MMLFACWKCELNGAMPGGGPHRPRRAAGVELNGRLELAEVDGRAARLVYRDVVLRLGEGHADAL
jgi:hypothetical protein